MPAAAAQSVRVSTELGLATLVNVVSFSVRKGQKMDATYVTFSAYSLIGNIYENPELLN